MHLNLRDQQSVRACEFASRNLTTAQSAVATLARFRPRSRTSSSRGTWGSSAGSPSSWAPWLAQASLCRPPVSWRGQVSIDRQTDKRLFTFWKHVHERYNLLYVLLQCYSFNFIAYNGQCLQRNKNFHNNHSIAENSRLLIIYYTHVVYTLFVLTFFIVIQHVIHLARNHNACSPEYHP